MIVVIVQENNFEPKLFLFSLSELFLQQMDADEYLMMRESDPISKVAFLKTEVSAWCD